MIDKQGENSHSNNSSHPDQDDEIDLLALWSVIWKRKKMIIYLTVIIVMCTAIGSLFMTDIFEAKGVIAPVANKQAPGGGALSTLSQQFGGIASLAGISLPGGSSTAEIEKLLHSNILREKLITRYNLLRVIFHDKWDEEKEEWAKPNIYRKTFSSMKSSIMASLKPGKEKKNSIAKEPGVPSMWDGLRALDNIIIVTVNKKTDLITIAARMDDPETAAKIVSYAITELTDHMSGEAKRVAETNKRYLTDQLSKAVDPVIRQKIYTLLGQQVETSLMSEVKENFAFKVLDPPRAPDRKIKPKRALMVLLSLFASMFAGVFIAFFREYLDKMKGAAVSE